MRRKKGRPHRPITTYNLQKLSKLWQQAHRPEDASTQGLRRQRVFTDRTHPLEMYCACHRGVTMNLVALIDDDVYVFTQKGSLRTTQHIFAALRFFACGIFQLVVGDLFGNSKYSA